MSNPFEEGYLFVSNLMEQGTSNIRGFKKYCPYNFDTEEEEEWERGFDEAVDEFEVEIIETRIEYDLNEDDDDKTDQDE